MNAAQIAVRLLEDGADEINPQRYVDDYAEFGDFDRGARDIVDDARRLYRKLKAAGVLKILAKDLAKGTQTGGPDESSVAQALLKIATERRGALGPVRVEKWLRRHASDYL